MNKELKKINIVEFNENEMSLESIDSISIEAFMNYICQESEQFFKEGCLETEIIEKDNHNFVGKLQIKDDTSKNVIIFVLKMEVNRFNKIMAERNIVIQDLKRLNKIIDF